MAGREEAVPSIAWHPTDSNLLYHCSGTTVACLDTRKVHMLPSCIMNPSLSEGPPQCVFTCVLNDFSMERRNVGASGVMLWKCELGHALPRGVQNRLKTEELRADCYAFLTS